MSSSCPAGTLHGTHTLVGGDSKMNEIYSLSDDAKPVKNKAGQAMGGGQIGREGRRIVILERLKGPFY